MNKPIDAPLTALPPASLAETPAADPALALWQQEYAEQIGAADRDVTNRSGVPVKPLYTAADWTPSQESAQGLPGQAPYTRGIYATMHRGRTWTQQGLDVGIHSSWATL